MKILNQFQLEGAIVNCAPYGNGHINDTYRVETVCDVYILQRINTNVFKSPTLLMENIGRVTRFIQDKIQKQGGDPLREALTLIPTFEDCDYAVDEDGNYWRMYRFIQDTVSYDLVLDAHDFYESGRAFGNFQFMLADFPVSSLHSTIEDFHHTPKRFQQFKSALKMMS